MPPRRRTTGTTQGSPRRPRVAGLVPATARAPGATTPGPESAAEPEQMSAAAVQPGGGTGTVAPAESDTATSTGPGTDQAGETTTGGDQETATLPQTPAAPEPATTTSETSAPTAAPPVASTPPARGLPAMLRARPGRVLAVAAALFGVVAIGLGVADHLVRSTPAAANAALADVGATTDVAGQLNSALETVYSYDFTQLDENERLAREVITPEFAVKFDQLFAQVRQLAPQQQAVVSATVTTSAVQSIEGDRAVLVAFLDQQATRANAGTEPQQLNAAGRLTVIAQRDGDAWKIADVINR